MADGEKRSVGDWTKRELYELAKKKAIKGRGSMGKAALYEALGLGSAGPVEAAVTGVPGVTSAPAGADAATSAGAPAAAPAPPPPSAPEAGPYVERGAPIPDTYGEDKLMALVRDPRWVFCYWELEGGACQRIIDERGSDFLSSAAWVVREHNLTAGSSTDAPVDAGAGNWYLKVEPESRYRFEIGVVSPGGEFLAVASSAEVETPPEGVSDEVDEQWMLVRADLDRLIEAMGGVQMGVPGSALGKRFEFPKELARFSGAISSRGISSRGGRR